ncbi:ABC transporter permease [Nocardiopsis mangrovi]|uniref:ABC transporter permease n=1 Tax=Nocardiopsis mangrovi TaxID=1179818 RepID=A0ABV9DWC2_9ACTN
MTTSAQAATARAGTSRRPGAGRTPVSRYRQTVRLLRTELVLFYRYRVALFFAAFPLMFVAFALPLEGQEPVPGIDAAALNMSGIPVLAALSLGLMHVPNVYAARREQLVLKRFRASGVAPAALFGATTLSVLLVVAVLTAVVAGIVAARYGALPADPLLVLAGVVLVTVAMSLFGIAFTRLTRNAESAQMMCIVPFMLLYGVSGLVVPLDLLPEPIAAAAALLPTTAAAGLVRSGYWGHDLFGGVAGGEPAGFAELWTAALPSIGILIVWTAVAVSLLRYFRWDPRQAG